MKETADYMLFNRMASMVEPNAMYGMVGINFSMPCLIKFSEFLFAKLKEALPAIGDEEWVRIQEIKGIGIPGSGTFTALYSVEGHDIMKFASASYYIAMYASKFNEVDPPKFMEEINSVTQITPKNPYGYIVAARIAECAGKKKEAKELIKRGYKECPSNEDVWVVARRFASTVKAKKLIDKALKAIPNSVTFHKAVLEQADEKDSRNLLQKAVNSCYNSAIWSAICILKEADRKIGKVGKILEWGIKSMHLQRQGAENDKKVSKEEAEFVEQSSYVTICKDIIHKTFTNLEKNLMKRVLRMNDQRLKQESGKDLKRKLHEIFDEDWNSIPEGEDFSSLNRNRAEELASTLDAIPISGFRAIDPEVYLAGLQFEDELRSFDLDGRRNM